MMVRKRFALLFVCAVSSMFALFLTGCNKDTDPHEKIDAPGYYNGPMGKKATAPTTGGTGGSAGGAAATTG